jgi:hypothetical protein
VSCLEHQASSIIENEKLQQSCYYWINKLHIKKKIGENENFGHITILTTFVQISHNTIICAKLKPQSLKRF